MRCVSVLCVSMNLPGNKSFRSQTLWACGARQTFPFRDQGGCRCGNEMELGHESAGQNPKKIFFKTPVFTHHYGCRYRFSCIFEARVFALHGNML